MIPAARSTERAAVTHGLAPDEETDVQDQSEDRSADFDAQGATARPGGEAKGGSASRPSDAGNPKQADEADRKARKAMRDSGFGDDKGGDIS